MFKFIKEALSEFDHVVWPTPTETRKYMLYTVGTIIVVGLLLAISDYVLRSGLSFVREDVFDRDSVVTTPTTSGEETIATPDEIQKITEQLEAQKATQSSGATTSGSLQ